MPQTPSPLRYPGGKTSIFPMISNLIQATGLERGHYAEPYAGGCGLALSLMFKGIVHELHLNDLDRSVWSFWDSLLNHTDRFIKKIENTEITLDEWYIQREIQQHPNNYDDFELGFSSFFLNRTNRSGVILKAGVIGGFHQSGTYKLDCRFKKDVLIDKIQRIRKYRHRIHLYNLDAIDFLQQTDSQLPNNSIYCIDPPYFIKGSTLYTNFYEPQDHAELSELITQMDRPWILTYDDTPEIQQLYSDLRQYRFDLNYSAATKRVGTELLVVNDHVIVPGQLNLAEIA